MQQLMECVPNFSEGRNLAVIELITKEISDTEEVKLLDVDPGADTNRTVVTLIGSPAGVKEAAFRAIRKAAELIDMTKHHGAHARMGATDVCPFVPVSGCTMDDCVQMARELGERVAKELNIPVYLYEEAASRPERANLANVRKGEYEGLEDKLKDPDWQPDFGEPIFNAKSGATIIGAREFLIAYNVNLNTRARKLAHEIALNIREAGRAKRDDDGNIVRDENGKAIKVPGTLIATKAVGWYIDEYKQAQVSINLINYKITPPHLVFDEICKEAEKLGLRVTGSELVGLIPLQALLMAGKHYLLKQGLSPGIPEKELIDVAVKSLGLNDISPFDPQKKIIEYQFREIRGPLVSKSVGDFSDELSMDSPAPGGGSVAALAGALGSALASMVANLTSSKKGYEHLTEEMNNLAERAQELKDFLLNAVDEDTNAFNRVMAAFGLPKKTEEQKTTRLEAIQLATKEATEVPLAVMEYALEAMELAKVVAVKGLDTAASDAGVAALIAQTGVEGAGLNVSINLASLEDKDLVEKTRAKVRALHEESRILEKEILAVIYQKIES